MIKKRISIAAMSDLHGQLPNPSEIDAVDDLDELLRVINDPELTEFQYLVDGDNWTVSLK